METTKKDAIKKAVRERYGEVARRFLNQGRGSCCDPGPVNLVTLNPASDATRSLGVDMGRDAYGGQDLAGAPLVAADASLGCGNPLAMASLRPGETVLDLGCGGGLDVLLAARQVGPAGRVYGLDQNEEMLALARRNTAAAGADNVVLLRGDIESIPLPAEAVDVVISNCVINLSTDKASALSEAHRVLKPRGRLEVSDMVLTRPLPAWAEEAGFREHLAAWSGCVAGAFSLDEYREALADAGFTDVQVEVRSAFPCPEETPWGQKLTPEQQKDLDGILASSSVRARRPD